MTTTTKFGVSLIQSAPKKCPFRYDLVWCKSASCGFLSAKKQPLRKHEMIYVFYEKLPFYDISSHKHKFIDKEEAKDCDTAYGKTKIKPPKTAGSRNDPPLPDSLICVRKSDSTYGNSMITTKKKQDHQQKYEPPLPTSLIKQDVKSNNIYHNHKITHYKERKGGESMYEPPLPNSLIKENNNHIKDGQIYNGGKGMNVLSDGKGNQYDPPLPNSLLEVKSTRGKHSTEKPVDLMKWILKYYSKEGDVILDPTMGSGSMGVACEEMKRNFIGIEKDDDIFNVANERLKQS